MWKNNLIKIIPILEKVSALTISNNKGMISRLEANIEFASRLEAVNTEGVEPMYHIDEGGKLYLQEDKVEPQDKLAILSNSGETMEDYFVAPMSKSFQAKKSKTLSDENIETQI